MYGYTIGSISKAQSSTRFRVLVYYPSDIEVRIKPDFLKNLIAYQQVELGKSFKYGLGPPINADGARMTVEADLGRARTFTEYDEQTNSFLLHGELMKLIEIGRHEYSIVASYRNATFEEEWRESFTIEIVYSEFFSE